MVVHIRIENLPAATTEEEVRDLLKDFCLVDDVKINAAGSADNVTAWIDVPTNRTHGYLIVNRIKTLVWKGQRLNAYAALFGSR